MKTVPALDFVKNGTDTYYYRFNLQGDVTGIYDADGDLIAEYTYDAWGKTIALTGDTEIGNLNPIRYRGYYYDIETGLYYVSSRYYDPEIGRWINADGVIAGTSDSVQGYNQFAYCFNNPINMDDETGHWPKWIKKAAKAVGNFVKKVAVALEESFQIELGFGVGLETSLSSSLAKLEIGAYQDGYTLGYANGDDYTSVKISAGATAAIAGIGFDGSYELEHRHETNGNWNRDGHDAFTSPFELAECDKSYIEKPQGFSVKPKKFSSKKAVASFSNEDVFIGLSGSAHVIIGGHFQVGINVTRFIEVFADE